MAIFKSRQEKEIEKKMLVKRTINTMNKQINALEEQKKVFVEKAKTAKKNGLEAQYNLALTGYKMTLLQQKRAQEMLLNFEITSQMKDMTMMTKEFLGGMSVLSKEMGAPRRRKGIHKGAKAVRTRHGQRRTAGGADGYVYGNQPGHLQIRAGQHRFHRRQRD